MQDHVLRTWMFTLLFMTQLDLGWELFVRGYALAWFLVNNRLRMFAYQILDIAKGKPKEKKVTIPIYTNSQDYSLALT